MKITYFNRTLDQLREMGYQPENTFEEIKQKEQQGKIEEEHKKEEHHISAHKVDFNKPLVEESAVKEEALSFPTICHECGLSGINQMCAISVPYFKELIIMSFSCENCGAKAREVKVGGYNVL
jgi:zinc finger protein